LHSCNPAEAARFAVQSRNFILKRARVLFPRLFCAIVCDLLHGGPRGVRLEMDSVDACADVVFAGKLGRDER
jgi:hypothetical protein